MELNGEDGGMFKNFYLILGVDRESSPSQIKQAFRRIVKRLHPDTTACGSDPEKFLEAREAYETLADNEKRQRYDAELADRAAPAHIARATARRFARQHPMPPFQPGLNEFDTVLKDLFPGGSVHPRRRSAQRDVCLEVVLSPRESLEGGLFPVSFPVAEPCPRCGTTGRFLAVGCPVCGGARSRVVEREFALGIPPRTGHGTAVTLHLEEIGLRGVNLHVHVHVDPMLPD